MEDRQDTTLQEQQQVQEQQQGGNVGEERQKRKRMQLPPAEERPEHEVTLTESKKEYYRKKLGPVNAKYDGYGDQNTKDLVVDFANSLLKALGQKTRLGVDSGNLVKKEITFRPCRQENSYTDPTVLATLRRRTRSSRRRSDRRNGRQKWHHCLRITGGLNRMAKRYNLRPRPSYKKVGCCGPYCLPESERYKRHPCPSYRKKKRCFTPYIAPEIIFNILVFLPADVLYNVMRYVCREWYNIISSSTFIDAHLQKAERGILIKQNWPDCSLQFVQMVKHDCPKLSKVHLSGFSNYISTSYNGLALFSRMELGNRFVANLVTKKVVALPPPSAASGANRTLSYIGCTTKKKYKLVEFYNTRLRTFEGAILTLGVDKEWRCIFQMNDTWRFKEFGASIFIFEKPIATGGFLHWTHDMLPLILNLDLETETLCMCTAPECAEMKYRRYLGTGSPLRIMDRLGKFLWGLWMLKDAETGEWTKLASLDLRPQEQMLRSSLCPPGFQLLPAGWLKDGQIAILCVEYEDGIERQVGYHVQTRPTRTCITCTFATGAVNSFQLRKGRPDDMHQSTKYIPYVKSLVSSRFAAT